MGTRVAPAASTFVFGIGVFVVALDSGVEVAD